MFYWKCVHCHGRPIIDFPAGHKPGYPGLLAHTCSQCERKWFSCDGSCHVRGRAKNLSPYYNTFPQAQRHLDTSHTGATGVPHSNHPNPAASHVDQSLLDTCLLHHNHPDSSSILDMDLDQEDDDVSTSTFSTNVITESESKYPDIPALINERDGDEYVEPDYLDLHYLDLPPVVESESSSQMFARHMVEGQPLKAASLLVSRASYGTDSLSSSTIPMSNIMFFLYLAKLVIATGTLQLTNLSHVLSCLVPYTQKWAIDWAPIPCTVSGLRSRFLNVSNCNSMVSILPIPTPESLPDGHGYTPFRSLLTHALMMKTFDAADIQDPKWKSIATCDIFLEFITNIPPVTDNRVTPLIQLAIALILWTDGWDTSTGCESNRSPMHAGTVTMLIVDVEAELVV